MKLLLLVQPLEKVLLVLPSLGIKLVAPSIKKAGMVNLFMISHGELHVRGGLKKYPTEDQLFTQEESSRKDFLACSLCGQQPDDRSISEAINTLSQVRP